jgi:hypothetical protein
MPQEKETEEIFEIMAENFPKLRTDANQKSMKLREHQTEQIPKKTQKRPTLRYIIFKQQKRQNFFFKEIILKVSRGQKKYLKYRNTGKNYIELLLGEHANKKKWNEVYKGLNKKRPSSLELPYPEKLSLKSEGEKYYFLRQTRVSRIYCQ